MARSLVSYVQMNRRYIIGSLIAGLLITVIAVVPGISHSVSFSLLYIPFLGTLAFGLSYVTNGVILGVLGVIIAATFYLLRINRFIVSSVVGLAFSFIGIMLYAGLVGGGLAVQVAVGVLMSTVLFFVAIKMSAKLRINTAVSVIVAIIFIVLGSYGAELVNSFITIRSTSDNEKSREQAFETARRQLDFSVYYPAYQSSILPASVPELNGYDSPIKSILVNPHITYTLGTAQVTESAMLKNQEKIMDFTYNCDIATLARVMQSEPEVSSYKITQSLDNPQHCVTAQTLPTGENIYFSQRGQWTYFYVKLGTTNIVIEFDNIKPDQYDDTRKQEVLKIINSLQIISLNKIQRGN